MFEHVEKAAQDRWIERYGEPEPRPALKSLYAGAGPVYETQTVGVNHALHLVLTILTCGLWAPVWLFRIIMNGPNYTETRIRANTDAPPWQPPNSG